MEKYNIHGVKTLSNAFSLQVELSRCGQAARIIPTYENKVTKPRWQEIKFDHSGNSYVKWNGSKHYLNEFIKIN